MKTAVAPVFGCESGSRNKAGARHTSLSVTTICRAELEVTEADVRSWRWRAFSPLAGRPSVQCIGPMERMTTPRLTCSITSSASTMLNADTRQSATEAHRARDAGGISLGGCQPNRGQAKPLTNSGEIGARHCGTRSSREFDVETGNPLGASAHSTLLITRPFFLRLSV
jgi:hypothetical protein